MKKYSCIVSLCVLTSVIVHAMEYNTNVHTLALVKALQKREDVAFEKNAISWYTPSASKDDIELRLESAEKECVQAIDKVEKIDIEWPAGCADHNLYNANISQKGLHTLCVARDGHIASLFDTVPYHIDCSALAHIDVSHNRLQELPLNLILNTCSAVSTLDASHNMISCITISSAKRASLKKLNLSHNALDSKFNISSLLSHYPLESLDISHNQLTDVLISLREYYDACPTIDVSHNKISKEASERLCKAYVDYCQKKILNNMDDPIFLIPLAGLTGIPTGLSALALESGMSEIGIVGVTVSMAGLGATAGMVTARLCYYLYHRSELRKIEQEAREKIICGYNTSEDI